MAKIENKRPAGKRLQNIDGRPIQFLAAGNQDCVVQISLHGANRLQGFGDPVQRYVLVQTNAIDAGFRHIVRRQLTDITRKSDHRHTRTTVMQPLDDAAGRLHAPPVELVRV